jgi:iron complex transport system substrate-binding protein
MIFLFLALLLTEPCWAETGHRIISLAPNTTEILFALGLGDYIVGVDEFSNYPDKAKNIERVGSFNNPNIENIILLKPDFIIVNTELENDKADYLKGMGIKIMVISPKNIEGLCNDIKTLGAVFDREKNAEAIIKDIKIRTRDVSHNIKGERPKVFVQLFDDPLITVSSFISDIIGLAGGDNIAQDIKAEAGIFSYEALIQRNPDIIIIIGFSGNANFPDSINAVKNNKVYKNLDPDILLRPGPRVIEAIEQLNRIFYE